jgi:2-keto-4-pentenoate hydratase/2-oxohepta-3-ene-1,7-dioic acid hydratase in catechol pathway
MKLVTFEVQTQLGVFQRLGAFLNDEIVDLNLGYVTYLTERGEASLAYQLAQALIPPDMIRFLEGGKASKKAARECFQFVDENRPGKGPRNETILYQKEEIKILAPIPRPPLIRDFMSFEIHAKHGMFRGREEIPPVWYEIPVYYKANPGSVVGPDSDIEWPSYSGRLDYELEFACVIGREGRDISRADALEYIAGYTIFNDFSARDIQKKEMSLYLGPAKGKDFDTATAIGPTLVTADEIKDPNNLRMVARINGELWSEGNSKDMYWRFPQIIEYISKNETIYPGEVLGSGTVGFGCGLELNRFLKPGDVIELEVEGIGLLRNKIVKKEKA